MSLILPVRQRENPLELPYEAPLVTQVTPRGVGFEILLTESKRYLIGHTIDTFPFIIGELPPSHLVIRNESTGRYQYSYRPVKEWMRVDG